jgi:hypothetical protein
MTSGHVLGEDLTVVEPGFLGEMSYQDRENLIGDLSSSNDGILAVVNVEDIIRNAPHE